MTEDELAEAIRKSIPDHGAPLPTLDLTPEQIRQCAKPAVEIHHIACIAKSKDARKSYCGIDMGPYRWTVRTATPTICPACLAEFRRKGGRS